MSAPSRRTAARLALLPTSILFAALSGPSLVAADLYWDVDGATSNGTVASGNWNGTNAFWNTDSSGAAGGSASAVTTSADNLFFSAGSTYKTGTVVTFSGTAAANSVTIEEGPITVGGTGGTFSLGAGGVTFNSGTGASHFGAASGSTFGIALQANTVFTTNNTATATPGDAATSQSINGSISGSFGFTKTGAGNLVLRGASTYTGATVINQGSIFMGGSAVLGASTGSLELHNTNTTLAGNHVRLTLNGPAMTKGSLSGTVATAASGTNRTIIDLNNRSLTINQTTNGTYAGEIITSTSGGSFTLGGLSTARLTLTGGLNYTGATVVSAGTLEIGSTGMVTNTSGITVNGGNFIYNADAALTKAITVNNGGTVGGTKSVAAVTINAGGSVSPGDGGAGTFTAQSLTWNSNDTTGGFNFDLGVDAASSDTLTLTGALAKGTGGTFLFNFNDVGAQSITYTLVTFGSTTFTDASVFSATGVDGTFAIDGNTLTFTAAIPEPSTYAVIAGALALCAVGYRRRRVLTT